MNKIKTSQTEERGERNDGRKEWMRGLKYQSEQGDRTFKTFIQNRAA